ncbi:MAG: hypothetical protein LBR25_02240 [Erysipelotrichaceae bacterium]|jgi:hypothetical protein|nr:hypothetical protein [Erysipelotrichaceae bacterium]
MKKLLSTFLCLLLFLAGCNANQKQESKESIAQKNVTRSNWDGTIAEAEKEESKPVVEADPDAKVLKCISKDETSGATVVFTGEKPLQLIQMEEYGPASDYGIDPEDPEYMLEITKEYYSRYTGFDAEATLSEDGQTFTLKYQMTLDSLDDGSDVFGLSLKSAGNMSLQEIKNHMEQMSFSTVCEFVK